MGGVQAEHMYFVGEGRLNYHHKHDVQRIEDGNWVAEPALWVQDWFYRGRLVSSEETNVIALSLSVWVAKIVRSSSSSKKSRLISYYAGHFLRHSSASCDDVWAPHYTLEQIAEEALNYALERAPTRKD